MFIFRQSSWTVIVLVVLISFKESVADDCKSKCRSDWVYNNGSCYSIILQLVSWENSVELCKTHGAKLAEIDGPEENYYLFRSVIDLFNSESFTGNPEVFWLGATDKRQDGTWVWASSGDEIPYSNWQVENDHVKGHCLASVRQYDFGWYDVSCTNTGNSICEHKTECSTAKY